MKRLKRIYLLLGILAVVCLATIGVMRLEEHKEKIRNTDEIILSVPADSVQALSWEYGSESFAFHREEKWLYDEDEAFPVDEEAINGLLEQFREFGAAFIIEEPEDYGQYGLDEPTCTIRLTAGEQSYEILLGDYSSMDSQRYVSIGDGNVYLVKNDPLDHFDVAVSDLIDQDEIPSFGEIEDIQFAGAENYNISYEEDSADTYCADDVYFISRDGETLPLDTSRVEEYIRNMRNLNLTDYVTYNVTDEELVAYGLDEPELTVTVKYRTEDENGEEISDTFVMNISRSPEEKAADVSGTGEDEGSGRETDVPGTGEGEGSGRETDGPGSGEDDDPKETTAYVRVGESQIVYQISSGSYEKLMAVSYDSLRHPEVFSGDTADIRQIDISLEDTVYTITSEDEDGGRTCYYGEKEVETGSLMSSLKNLSAVSFTQEQPEQKEEIGLVLYLDNEDFPEIAISLYRYDGDKCLAVVNGEPVSLVRRSDVVELIEAVHGIVLNQ